MSELSAAAAAALGIPEAIVQRSAAARAAETGMTVDEVLTAWAGGGHPATGSARSRSEAEMPPRRRTAEADPSRREPAGHPLPRQRRSLETPAAADTPVPAAPSVPGKPPVLVGEPDHPMTVLVGAVGLFVAVFLVGLVGPSIPTENPGARTSDLPYTETAFTGRRSTSLGVPPVTPRWCVPSSRTSVSGRCRSTTPTRCWGHAVSGRISPMSGHGSTASQIEAIITGLDDHPGLSSPEDLDDLVTYLVESVTSRRLPG